MGVRVRDRRATDADLLLAALRPVHEADGYPLHPHHLTAGWLFDGLSDAWVAEVDGQVSGHVAVAHDEDGHHVTRFFTAVDARGRGVGAALLEVVEQWADARGADLVLDVVEHNTDAQRLYASHGWVRTATVVAEWVSPDGPWPDAYVYRRPARPTPA